MFKNVLKEFLIFLLERKKFFLIPIFIMLFLMGIILVTSKGSVIAPFIYTVF